MEYQGKWLRPRATDYHGYSTSFSHIKRAWKEAHPEAAKERADTGFFVHRDGQMVDIRDGNGTFRKLRVQELSSLAIETATDAGRTVRSCMPAGCEGLYDTFDHRDLSDNLADPRSLFLQEANASLIEPIVEAVRSALLKPGERRHRIVRGNGALDMDALKRYARVENELLARFATHFALTCGITPREFQFKTLLYDSLHRGTLKWRCLFILDGCLCLGHPDAKKMTMVELAECLWGLTRIISGPFAFWMGVMRPVLTHLMGLVGQDVSLRDSWIFVRTFPARARRLDNEVMSGAEINAGMQMLSPDLSVWLTCHLLRTLFTTLFEQHHPGLLVSKKRGKKTTGEEEEEAETSAVLEQGQHRALVGTTHYIKSLNVPPALQMGLAKARRHLSVSRLSQTLLGLNQAGEGLDEELLRASPAYHWRRNKSMALAEARRLVVSHYKLGGRSGPDEIKRHVEDILDRCPFIYGNNVRWRSLSFSLFLSFFYYLTD